MKETEMILKEGQDEEAIVEEVPCEALSDEEIGEMPTEELSKAPSEVVSAISEEEAARLTADPMFSRFARGRQGSFDEILSAFREMLHARHSDAPHAELSAKMTPAVTSAVTNLPLSERQRAIARAAGMTYSEYYSILKNK